MNVPWALVETPVAILRRHSRNFACAARSCWKEFVRCSSSSSSCFFTCDSCWVERDARSTVRCLLAGGRQEQGQGAEVLVWPFGEDIALFWS